MDEEETPVALPRHVLGPRHPAVGEVQAVDVKPRLQGDLVKALGELPVNGHQDPFPGSEEVLDQGLHGQGAASRQDQDLPLGAEGLLKEGARPEEEGPGGLGAVVELGPGEGLQGLGVKPHRAWGEEPVHGKSVSCFPCTSPSATAP